MLSDVAGWFSIISESTISTGGAFQMQQKFTDSAVKFDNSWDLTVNSEMDSITFFEFGELFEPHDEASLYFDKPVGMIDWLSLSQWWHAACTVAVSSNPQPHDNVF